MCEMQAQLADVIGLYCTNSKGSVTSLSGSINTKEAFNEFCGGLCEVGVTADMIRQKKRDILNMFESHNTATGGQFLVGGVSGEET